MEAGSASARGRHDPRRPRARLVPVVADDPALRETVEELARPVEVGHLHVRRADRAGHVRIAAGTGQHAVLGGELGGPAIEAGERRLGVEDLDRVDQTVGDERLERRGGQVAPHRVERVRHVHHPALLADDAGGLGGRSSHGHPLGEEQADQLALAGPHLLADHHPARQPVGELDGAGDGVVVGDAQHVDPGGDDRFGDLVGRGGAVAAPHGVAVQVDAQPAVGTRLGDVWVTRGGIGGRGHAPTVANRRRRLAPAGTGHGLTRAAVARSVAMRGGQAGEVTRARLLAPLAGRFRRRLTLVEGGPGFGKSTLIAQAIAEAHGDPNTIDALVRVPPSGHTAATLVEAVIDTLNAEGPAAGSVRSLVDAVWARSPTEVCVVVDDVQWLDDAAVDVLDALVTELPANAHLLLAGRDVPRLRSADALAGHDVERLVERDLAFDADEREAFAAQRDADPTALSDHGWPALLELELRSGHSGAVRSLVETAVAGLEPSRLAVCRRLAVLDVVDDDLVDRLVGHLADGDAATAAALFAGVPLATVDGTVVRLHDLLCEALTAGFDDERRREAHRCAGVALEARGEHHRAIGHLAAAGDTDGLRRIARRVAADVHLGHTSAARRRLATELRELLGDDVEVDVVDAAFASVDDPVAAALVVEHARTRARTDGDPDLEALCEVRRADLAYGAADVVALEDAAAELESLAERGSPIAARLRHLPQIWLRALTDRHAEAVRYIAAVRGDPALDEPTRQLLGFYETVHLGYTGHARAALAEAAELRSLPGGLFANRLAGFEWVQRWHLGELDRDQLPGIVALVDRIDELGETHLSVEGAATVALFHASFGDIVTARTLTDRAVSRAHRLPDTAWAHHTVAQARAAVAVFDGDEQLAARILDDAVPDEGIASLPRHVYGVAATLVYVLCPSTREVWDRDEPGPDHLLRREIARALVALRERGDVAPAATLPWAEPHRLRPWAFEPHLAELAVAAVAAGVDEARAVIETLQHDPHGHLLRLPPSTPAPVVKTAELLAAELPRRPAHRVEVRVLGDVELLRDGRVVRDEPWMRRQRVRDLLMLLVHHRSIERQRLAALMWPDKPADAGSRNLRFTLNQLSNVLEPDRGPSEPTWFVRTVGTRLVLAGQDRLTIDADRFDHLVRDAADAERSGSPHRALDRLIEACELYGGDYLASASDPDWAYYEVIDRRGSFVQAACRAAELLLARGDIERANALGLRAATAEPENEPGQRALATALLAQGRAGAAREVLTVLTDRLAELDLTPDPRTHALAERLGLAGRPVVA